MCDWELETGDLMTISGWGGLRGDNVLESATVYIKRRDELAKVSRSLAEPAICATCGGENKSNAMLLMNEIKAQNAEMEESVTHFTMQLAINTRSNVVCGVAVLDMSFVTSILVGVTTLFIFLLQYDITYDALMQTRIAANLN
ncbi:putative gustatory receptor 59f isoform X2 [Eurosta solidaginis]|uniref:putative gustatory receptor 59f isoform X2 n=1 Tax=Eurosta solidaginis TaxID=178769 RepID=UPI003530FA4B